MSDESGRYTAEHTVMDANLEIRELKHLLVVKDEKIKELEKEIVQLKSPDYPKDDSAKTVTLTDGTKLEVGYVGDNVDYGVADGLEDEFTEQLSFTYNQE